MISPVEAYWAAVKARIVDEDELPSDSEDSLDENLGGRPAGSRGETVGQLSPLDFYFYRSIRHRSLSEKNKWGIFIVNEGLDIIADYFRKHTRKHTTATDARTAAIEFLMVCGQAHYQFDIYAMSCEAVLGRWLYPQFQKAEKKSDGLGLEGAMVILRAKEWAARHGLTDAVSDIFSMWSVDRRAARLPTRHLQAYLAFALLNGYRAFPLQVRFDQAEWVTTIPHELASGCPGPAYVSRGSPWPETTSSDGDDSLHTWFNQRGITKYSRGSRPGAGWIINQDVFLIGEKFDEGRFPEKIDEVDGDFVCIYSNLSVCDGLPSVVTGNVDLSHNPNLTSLENIYPSINTIGGGKLRLSVETITQSVAGLCCINGLREIDADIASGEILSGTKWMLVVNDCLSQELDCFDCQEALTNSDLDPFA